jgi:hypothetical protein
MVFCGLVVVMITKFFRFVTLCRLVGSSRCFRRMCFSVVGVLKVHGSVFP